VFFVAVLGALCLIIGFNPFAFVWEGVGEYRTHVLELLDKNIIDYTGEELLELFIYAMCIWYWFK
jgi:hypothetical protein